MSVAPTPAYVRRAEYLEAHDGDTITLRLDHGRFPSVRSCDEVPIRVRNLYCPELSEPGGREARDYVAALLSRATQIVCQTYKGSFARTIGDVWIDGQRLDLLVITAGHGTAEP